MGISAILYPVATILELAICVMGLYLGYMRKKYYGYFFALTFLLFGLFDFFNFAQIGPNTLSMVNIIAVLSALAGMYLLYREQ